MKITPLLTPPKAAVTECQPGLAISAVTLNVPVDAPVSTVAPGGTETAELRVLTVTTVGTAAAGEIVTVQVLLAPTESVVGEQESAETVRLTKRPMAAL